MKTVLINERNNSISTVSLIIFVFSHFLHPQPILFPYFIRAYDFPHIAQMTLPDNGYLRFLSPFFTFDCLNCWTA